MSSVFVPIVFAVAILAFLAGAFIRDNALRHHFHKAAIERGYAIYCPTTGDFAWKGEC